MTRWTVVLDSTNPTAAEPLAVQETWTPLRYRKARTFYVEADSRDGAVLAARTSASRSRELSRRSS